MPSHPRVAALAAALLIALAGAATAHAAEPAAGTVDQDNQYIEWSGEAMGTLVQYAHFFYGGQIVEDCEPPICDSFTLTVAEGAKKLEIGAEDASGYTEMQVLDAQGNELFWSEGGDGVPTVYVRSNPPAGVYTVEVLTDALAPSPVDDPSYTAYARFTPKDPPPAS